MLATWSKAEYSDRRAPVVAQVLMVRQSLATKSSRIIIALRSNPMHAESVYASIDTNVFTVCLRGWSAV